MLIPFIGMNNNVYLQEVISMKKLIGTSIATVAVLGLAVGALLVLRKCNTHTYITVEED